MQKIDISANTCLSIGGREQFEQFILNEGKKMYKQKKYESALQYFDKVIEINKNNLRAYKYLNRITKQLNKQKQFILKYTELIEIKTFKQVNYIKRGCLYYALQYYEGTLRDCDHAIQLDPEYSFVYYLRAKANSKLNSYQSALMDYQKAISLSPKQQKIYFQRALLYQKKEKWQQAINDYSRVIQINPNHQIAFNNRGVIYYEKNEIQKALSDFDQAIKLNPLCHSPYYNRASLYYKRQKYEELQKEINFKLIKVVSIEDLNLNWYLKSSFIIQKYRQYTNFGMIIAYLISQKIHDFIQEQMTIMLQILLKRQYLNQQLYSNYSSYKNIDQQMALQRIQFFI